MIITDLPKELAGIFNSEGITYEEAGERIGICRQNAWRLTHRGVFSPQLVNLLDAIGYDVEINFIKRE